MFVTLVKLRPIDHWPSNCKYDFKIEKITAPEFPWKLRCRKTSWYRKFDAKVFDFEPQVSNRENKLNNHFGTKHPGSRTTMLGRTKPIYKILDEKRAKCPSLLHKNVKIKITYRLKNIHVDYTWFRSYEVLESIRPFLNNHNPHELHINHNRLVAHEF